MSNNLRMSMSVQEAVGQAPEDLSKTAVGFSIHSSSSANNRMYLKSSDTESSHLPTVRKRFFHQSCNANLWIDINIVVNSLNFS